NMFIACSRFLVCERSDCQETIVFVGKWVMRTAESVVFTCCPPAPLERYVSIFKSSVLMSIYTSSSNSGDTSQETNDVCLLPEESKGEIRTNRCTPFSVFKYLHALYPLISNVTLLTPASSPAK